MEDMQDQFSDLDLFTRRGKARNARDEVPTRPRSLDEDDNVIAVPAEPMGAKKAGRSSTSSLEDRRCVEETSGRVRTNPTQGLDPDLQRTIQAVVDTSIKYYTDKILQVLEGYNQKIQTVEKVVERVQSDVNTIKTMMEEQCETYEGRFNSIDAATKENLRLTQLLRDRQEIKEAQEELKKLSKKPPTAPSSTKASEMQPPQGLKGATSASIGPTTYSGGSGSQMQYPQNIDLNVVLDKLMSEGATRAPGWN
eukprot:jgi/Pico_ML_1/55766/g1409.t1